MLHPLPSLSLSCTESAPSHSPLSSRSAQPVTALTSPTVPSSLFNNCSIHYLYPSTCAWFAMLACPRLMPTMPRIIHTQLGKRDASTWCFVIMHATVSVPRNRKNFKLLSARLVVRLSRLQLVHDMHRAEPSWISFHRCCNPSPIA